MSVMSTSSIEDPVFRYTVMFSEAFTRGDVETARYAVLERDRARCVIIMEKRRRRTEDTPSRLELTNHSRVVFELSYSSHSTLQ